jgi:hypothetical protein
MSDDALRSRLTGLLRTLKPKDKQPVSAAVLINSRTFQPLTCTNGSGADRL